MRIEKTILSLMAYMGGIVTASVKNLRNLRTMYRRRPDDYKREDRESLRPWGYYTVLSDNSDHKVKRINVYPGKRLSLQSHQHRSEHWHIIKGEALVTLGQKTVAQASSLHTVTLKPGGSIDIPRGMPHRIENIGKRDVILIEIQTGDYFGEDDIKRYEDDFGRT